ncbi:hypothetical protein lerEdw1_013863 [Lerista edwardsae]|nr:hypothetical protein lerEdw1_013863 [Lerista edwardsae]
MASRNREGKRPKKEGGERRKRTIYTKDQVDLLIKTFQEHRYPSFFLREKLAERTGIEEARLHVWFQNRRARQPKTTSASSDACNTQTVHARNPCPQDQPEEMQSNATAPAPNLVNNASSLPGRNWNVSYHSMQYWGSSYQQEASFHYQSSSSGSGLTVPVPQNNFGLDAVSRGMPSGLEGAMNLPMVQQPSQQARFFKKAQPDMNYLNPQQQVPWSFGNLQLGEQVCMQNFQYPVSPQNLYGMPNAMSHLNYNQAVVNEENVHTLASKTSSSPVLHYSREEALKRGSSVPFTDSMSVGSSSSLASPSPSVQWQEAAQEDVYPVALYENPLPEMAEYNTNWAGVENGNGLELLHENNQTQQQSSDPAFYFSSFQH